MSAPTEPRIGDVLTTAYAAVDEWYRDVFGLQSAWAPTVVESYLLDMHLARMKATNWEIAS